ncbi:MAG TPA: hypothetical protein VLD37_06555 [Candidatus Bilamarchaeum sp.]|nr:hypothetical protein [Candidatus Bilamarchaeum sp.]
MGEEETKREFIDRAYLLDSLYLFDKINDSRELAESLLSKCERMAGPDIPKFYSWLGRIMAGSATYCFYGSALILPEPADLDIMTLTVNTVPLFIAKPGFVHVLETRRCPGDIAKSWGSFLLGPLLFPREPPEFVLNAVDYCRESAFSSPFFDGGYGERLTYAAFKAIGNESLFEAGEWADVRHLERFKVEYRYFDATNMQTVPYSAQEVHDQIRKKLCQLEEKEMRALGMAAARKIGVKREHHAALAETFVRELKKMRR